jgi:hypothetical protein
VSVATFDLREPSYFSFSSIRTFRSIMFVIAALFSVLLGVLDLRAHFLGVPAGGSTAIIFVTLNVGAGFVVCLCVFGAWKTSPGATALRIDDRGLSFIGQSGRVKFVPWEGLRRGIVLLDYSANSQVAARLPQLRWEIRRRNGSPSALTREAFEAIVVGASEHGLRVDSRILQNPRWGWAACRAIRFRASERL